MTAGRALRSDWHSSASALSGGPSSRASVGSQAWSGLRPAQEHGEPRLGRAPFRFSGLSCCVPLQLWPLHRSDCTLRGELRGGGAGGKKSREPGGKGGGAWAGRRPRLGWEPALSFDATRCPRPGAGRDGTTSPPPAHRAPHLERRSTHRHPIGPAGPGRDGNWPRWLPKAPPISPPPSPSAGILWTAAWRPSSPPGPRPLEQMQPSCGRGADARARALLAGASSRWARESERRKRKGGRGRGVEEGREEEEEEVGARSRLASRPREGRGERGARAHARVLARSIHPSSGRGTRARSGLAPHPPPGRGGLEWGAGGGARGRRADCARAG